MDKQWRASYRRSTQHARLGSPAAIVVVGDHGEGLGDHGELQHGNLLYQSTMHVPLVVVGPGVAPATIADTPVSIAAGVSHRARLGRPRFGEQPARSRRITAGGRARRGDEAVSRLRLAAADHGRRWTAESDSSRARPRSTTSSPIRRRRKNLGAGANLPAALRKALDDYPVPSPEAARAPENLTDEARRNLASLGYVSASAPPVVRKDAPRPAEMVRTLRASREGVAVCSCRSNTREVIPLLEKILAADPHNLDAALRLATAHSSLGHEAQALAAFKTAAAIAPRSPDVRMYLALHYARGKDWQQAVPLLEQIVAETPERLPAVEALAVVRERQGRFDEAIALRQKVCRLTTPTAAELVRLGQLAMQRSRRRSPSTSFEKARAQEGPPLRTTSSSASSIWPRGGFPTRATRSIASRRHIPSIRWRSSSARR